MLWRASRARYMILVSVGFDNSPPKPLSSGLLKCLRRVSTFSSLFILHDSSFNNYPAGFLGFGAAVRKPQRLLAPGLQGRCHFPHDGCAVWALVLIFFLESATSHIVSCLESLVGNYKGGSLYRGSYSYVFPVTAAVTPSFPFFPSRLAIFLLKKVVQIHFYGCAASFFGFFVSPVDSGK